MGRKDRCWEGDELEELELSAYKSLFLTAENENGHTHSRSRLLLHMQMMVKSDSAELVAD